jgi:hypothetical protein
MRRAENRSDQRKEHRNPLIQNGESWMKGGSTIRACMESKRNLKMEKARYPRDQVGSSGQRVSSGLG